MARAKAIVADQPRGGFLENQLEAMSPRDKKLLVGLVMFFGLACSGVIGFGSRSLVNDAASRVRDSKSNLVLIQGMAEQYQEDADKIAKAEAHLQQYKNQPAAAYLEKLAVDTGVRETFTLTQQGSEVQDTLKLSRMRVELKNLSLDQTVKYVHALETGGYPLSIELARYKAGQTPTDGTAKPISLTLDIVTYQLAEGGT